MVGAKAKVTGPGELALVYNDCTGYYGDNTGSFTATVTVAAKGIVEGDLLLRDHTTQVGLGSVKVTGTDDTGGAVSTTLSAGIDGHYRFSLDPGSYVVAPDGDPPTDSGGTSAPDAVLLDAGGLRIVCRPAVPGPNLHGRSIATRRRALAADARRLVYVALRAASAGEHR